MTLIAQAVSELKNTVSDPKGVPKAVHATSPGQLSILESTEPPPTESPKEESSPQVEQSNLEEWLTTQEAYERYGKAAKISPNTFRKLRSEQFLERFGLEAHPNKKITGKHDTKWLKVVKQ